MTDGFSSASAQPGLGEQAEAPIPQTRPDPDLFELREAPPDDAKPRKSRTLPVIAAVLLAIIIVLGAIFGPTAWRILAQKDAALSTPETIGTLTRDDSEEAKQAVSDLSIALQAAIDLDATVGAIYNDAAAGPEQDVFFFGGTTLLYNPGRELDTVIGIMADNDEPIENVKNVDPGPLGGVMRCGGAADVSALMAVCLWADHGSLAMALFPGRTPDDAAVLMRQIRAATLTR